MMVDQLVAMTAALVACETRVVQRSKPAEAVRPPKTAADATVEAARVAAAARIEVRLRMGVPFEVETRNQVWEPRTGAASKGVR